MSYINWTTDQNVPLQVWLSLKAARDHLDKLPQPTFEKTPSEKYGLDLVRARKLDKRGIALELDGIIIRYEDFLKALYDENIRID